MPAGVVQCKTSRQAGSTSVSISRPGRPTGMDVPSIDITQPWTAALDAWILDMSCNGFSVTTIRSRRSAGRVLARCMIAAGRTDPSEVTRNHHAPRLVQRMVRQAVRCHPLLLNLPHMLALPAPARLDAARAQMVDRHSFLGTAVTTDQHEPHAPRMSPSPLRLARRGASHVRVDDSKAVEPLAGLKGNLCGHTCYTG